MRIFEIIIWVYNFLELKPVTIVDFLPFLKNFDFSKTFLDKYTKIKISVTFPLDLFKNELILTFRDLGVNLLTTTLLKEIKSQPAS